MDAANLMFGAITLRDLRANAPLIKPVLALVKRACEYSSEGFTVDGVTNGLISGRFRLWVVAAPPADLQAVAVGQAIAYDDGERELSIPLIGGPNVNALLNFLPDFAKAAAAWDCLRFKLYGPSRWDHKPAFGRRPASSVYEADA